MNAVVRQGLSPVRQVLANGAVALVQETHTHPAVTVLLSMHAGSAYDPPDAVGVSHFLSRVIDRGTIGRSADAIAEELDGRGVSLSTGVSRHLFTAGFTCLAEDLAVMFELCADILRHPTFPAREVATRRSEIVTSIRQDEDSPAAMASEALMELIYPHGHPYGRPAKGSVPVVEAIVPAQLADFHARHFTPGSLMLTIVGEVEPARAIDLASASFGDWTAPAAPRLVPSSPEPPPHRQVRLISMPGKAQADVAYGFAALTRRDPEYYALYVMNTVLGQYGLGGRLGDSIRERQGMAYYAFSSFEGNVAEGPLVVRAGVAPGNVDRTIESIDHELRIMRADGVTDAELSDARRYLVGSMPRMLETNGGIASFLQSVEMFDLGLDFDRRVPLLFESVTRDEVHAVAERLLDPDRASVVVAGPGAAGQPQRAGA